MEEEKHNDSEVHKLEGNEHYKKKNFQEALAAYDRAIALKKEPLYYNNKAAVFIELKQYDNALQTVDEALQVMEDTHQNDFTKKAKLYARRAKVLYLKGNLAESIQFYEKSLLEDSQPAVKDELIKVKREKVEQDKLNYINPELAEQHNKAGNDLFKEGKFPLALKEYDEASRRNPKEAKYYCNKATSLMKLMEFHTAIVELDKCLECDPKYVKAFVKKGHCHTIMKDFKKARDVYEAGLKIDPNNQELSQGLEKVKTGIFSTQGETEEEQKARASRAVQDPEIQQILREPEVVNLLQDMQRDPQNAMQALVKNKDLATKIEKLIAAGVLKVG